FMVPVPLWLFAIFNVGQDLFRFVGQQRTGVAVVVHLAGALFAYTYWKFQFRLLDVVGDWKSFTGGMQRLKRRRARPRLRLFRPEDADVRGEPVGVPAAT